MDNEVKYTWRICDLEIKVEVEGSFRGVTPRYAVQSYSYADAEKRIYETLMTDKVASIKIKNMVDTKVMAFVNHPKGVGSYDVAILELEDESKVEFVFQSNMLTREEDFKEAIKQVPSIKLKSYKLYRCFDENLTGAIPSPVNNTSDYNRGIEEYERLINNTNEDGTKKS